MNGKYQRNKTDENLNNVKRLEKEYKRVLDKSIKEHRKNLKNKLADLRSSNPKDYWKILNCREKKNKVHVSMDDLHDFFKELNSDHTSDNTIDHFDLENNTSNDTINGIITKEEIEKAISKLKNNKSSSDDEITNEFIKHSTCKMLDVYVKLFNAIFDTGKVPDTWLTGNIIPLYKNKGSVNDPKNYRPITLVSCFGKLFTAVLNNRLNKLSDEISPMGEIQAGFRKGYSTLDNVFVLHMLMNLLRKQRKKLHCVFIDFEKAFDKVWRDALWYKMILNQIDGKMYNTIYNMYQGIKSCVVSNGEKSGFFPCNTGLRQGENLSPFLFSLYLNDIESFLGNSNVKGAKCVSTELEERLNVYLKLFILLYADDTVLFSESLEDLQLQLNLFYDYCAAWRLKVNISKTKAIIFSRTRPQQNTRLYFGEDLIEYVENFTYLGVNLSRNGSFNDAKKSNVKKATIAMYEILKKGRKFNLSISCQYDLFEKIVRPILLYGCEIWGYTNVEIIERVHLKFCKLLLGVKKSTPSFMIYGELGTCPMYVFIKSRIINYWARVTNTRNEQKLTRILYMLLFSKYEFENLKFPWIEYVNKILNDCGLSNVWFIQGALNLNWLNNIIKRILLDQFK